MSCKKEVSPELEVTVVDGDDKILANRWVKLSVGGADNGILNAEVIDSSATDQFGKAFFSFSNTVLVDVALYRFQNSTTIIDSTSVLLETKRQRGDENKVERKLVFR